MVCTNARWRVLSPSGTVNTRGGRTGRGWPATVGADRRHDRLRDQTQADLAAAHQLDINLREQLRVEQRAVMDAMRAVDAVARAERVERMLGARMPLSRERERVDHPRQADGIAAAPLQLAVEKAEVEPGIMRDQRRVGDEVEQVLHRMVKRRVLRQEFDAQSMHARRLLGHVAFGMKVGVEDAARLDPVDELDAADLHHPVAARETQSGGFGVEHDLPHGVDL
jgi:hypothetical protein